MRRLLVTLVVDTSDSMNNGDAIGELNRALEQWRGDLTTGGDLSRLGEIALISFGAGGVQAIDPSGGRIGPVDEPFVAVTQFSPRPLAASGYTPMTDGIRLALDVVKQRREALLAEGIMMAYRPLVYLVTDGAPTDDDGNDCRRWRSLVPELRRLERELALLFFAFGVTGADMDVLRALAPASTYNVEGTDFGKLLRRVSGSIKRVMRTNAEEAGDLYSEIRSQADENTELSNWFWKQGQQ
jgi:uncharacterized protein YegL